MDNEQFSWNNQRIEQFSWNNQVINDFCWNTVDSKEDIGSEVYFVIYTGGSADAYDSAKTRIEQIKKQKNYNDKLDKIYYIEVSDLGKLEEEVERRVEEAICEGYGKTVEVSFFGHGGGDGPIGRIEASRNSLSDITRRPFDGRQLSPTGWKEIDFNFDPDGSFAVFYGCKTIDFAQQFLHLQPNVKFTSGIDGNGGASSNEEIYKINGLNFWEKPAYFGSYALRSMEKDIFSRDSKTKLGNTYLNSEAMKINMRRATVIVVGNVSLEKINMEINKELENTSEDECVDEK